MDSDLLAAEPDERAKHLSAIQSLSEQFHLPPESVAEVYIQELQLVSQDALIRSYLSIFASRRVSEIFHKGLVLLASAAGRGTRIP